jgi:cytochrome P450
MKSQHIGNRIVVSPASIVNNFLLFQKDTLQFLLDAQPLGDVVFFKTGNLKPSYVINAPEFIQEILVTKDASFRKGRASNVLRRTIGDGLLTTEGESHKRQKALMMPVFYKERIQSYGAMMIEEATACANRWQDGDVLNLNTEMMKLTLSIITRTMFGTAVDEERKAAVAEAVNVTIARSSALLYSPVQMPFFAPTPGNIRHKKALRTLDELIDDILLDMEHRPADFAETMIGLLSAVRDADGQPLPRSEIRDQMMTMLIAGHETTANALTWAFYLLGQNEAVRERLVAEAKAASWGDSSAMELYRSLTYTQLCVQETLRLYPPAWLILREAAEDVEIAGEMFVKGSSLLISPYALHRNEQVFSEPLRYWPERFADGKTYPRFSYFPFGGGARSCIGSTFALMEATLIMAVLSKHVQLLPTNEERPQPETSVSLRMKNDWFMRVSVR